VTIIDQQSTDPNTLLPVDETSVRVAAGFKCKSDCEADLTTTALSQQFGFLRIAVQPAGFCAQLANPPPASAVLLPSDQPVEIPGNEIQSIPVRKGPANLWFSGLLPGLAAFSRTALGVNGGPGFANFSLSFDHKGGEIDLDAPEDVTSLPLPATGSTVGVDVIVTYSDTSTDSESLAPAQPEDIACTTVTAQIVRIPIGSPL
jgi:hypothetical protein